MNKIINTLVLSSALMAPVFTHAATFALGDFPGATGFSNADLNSGSVPPRNQLPSNGVFSDDWNFDVAANSGGGSNVSITGIQDLNLTGLSAVLLGSDGFTASFMPLFSNSTNEFLGLTFGALNVGSYTLRVTGSTVGTSTEHHSYSGNLTIGEPSSVPIPGAVWLFGSALAGLIGVSGRNKKANALPA